MTRSVLACSDFSNTLLALTLALMTAACASAPPAPSLPPPPPRPAGPTFEQKMAWILRLEDQRVLRDPAPQARDNAPVERVIPRCAGECVGGVEDLEIH